MNIGDNVVWRFLDKKFFRKGTIINFIGETHELIELEDSNVLSTGERIIIKQSEIEIHVI